MNESNKKIFYVDSAKTGENIRSLAEERGISVKELQEMLDLAYPQPIYRWYKGITLPSVDNLCVLSRTFKVSIDEIIVISEIDSCSPSLHEDVAAYVDNSDMSSKILEFIGLK